MKKQLLVHYSIIGIMLFAKTTLAQDLWTPSESHGFGDVYNYDIKCMQTFKGSIYAGTGNDTAAIYSSPTGNTGSWQNKFSSSSIYGIQAFGSTTEGGGYLYASTTSSNIYRSADGNTWDLFYQESNTVNHINAFKGTGATDSIYIFESTGSGGDIVKRAAYNNTDPYNTLGTWDTVFDFNSFGSYASATSTIVYNGKLYMGTNDGTLYSTANGTTWTQNPYVGLGFGDYNNQAISALGIYGGYLYAATYNSNNGTEVWRSDTDSAWVMVAQFAEYERITSFADAGGQLWIAMNAGDTGTGKIAKSADGLTFITSVDNGFNMAGNNGLYSTLLPFGNNIYYSTENYSGGVKSLRPRSRTPLKPEIDALIRGRRSVIASTGSTGGQIWRSCLGTPPVIDLGADQTTCTGDMITLNAGPGNAYYWSNGSTTQTITITPATGITSYNCVVTDASGCDGMDTISINTRNAPILSPITPYTQYATICKGDSLGLLTNADPNLRNPLTPLHKVTDAPIYDYQTLQDTIAVSGVAESAPIALLSVSIDSLYHTYDGDLSISLYAPDGSFADLSTNNGSGGENYTGTVFSMSATQNIYDGTAPFTGTFTPQQVFGSFSGPANGNWRLQITDGAGGDEGVLKGWSMQFSVADSIITFSWSPSTGLSGSSVLNPTFTATTFGYNVYQLTATNDAGCSSTFNDTLIVPGAQIVPAQDSICSGSSVVLNLSYAAIGNPVWSPGATLSSTSGFSVTATPVGTTTYHVTDNTSGCFVSDSVTIYTGGGAFTASAGADQLICHGDTATIAATATGGVAPYTYLWTDGSTLLHNQTEAVVPLVNTTYTLTVADAYSCLASDAVTITSHPSTDIYGRISYSGGNVTGSNVVIYRYEPYLVHFDTVQVSTTDANGYYHFTAIDHNSYLVEAFPAASYSTLVPTYYGNTFLWDAATTVSHDCFTVDTFNIAATEITGFGTGPGYLHGEIDKGPGYGTHPGLVTAGGGSHERGEPIPGIDVKLGRNPGGQMVSSTTTASDGTYSFSNVPFGNYTVYADIPGLARDSSYTITVDSVNYIYNYLDYIVDSTTIRIVENAGVGITVVSKGENKLSVYPNPSQGDATLEYTIDKAAAVSLGIYNVLGVKVTELVNTQQAAGTYTYSINGKNYSLSSGVYFVTLLIDAKKITQRLVITE